MADVLAPSERLENVIELSLGTVLKAINGHNYIFVGTHRNSAGLVFWFHPEIGSFRGTQMTATYALVDGGFRMFPGLINFLKSAP